MGMFKNLHPENLNQLRDLLDQVPGETIYFHADGNFYLDEKKSDTHQKFTNFNAEGTNHPANVGARYRVKFTSTSQVPTSLDALEKMFLENKQKEDTAASEPAERKGNFVFKTGASKAAAEATGTDTGTEPAKTSKGGGKGSKAADKAAELAAVTGTGEAATGAAGTAQ